MSWCNQKRHSEASNTSASCGPLSDSKSFHFLSELKNALHLSLASHIHLSVHYFSLMSSPCLACSHSSYKMHAFCDGVLKGFPQFERYYGLSSLLFELVVFDHNWSCITRKRLWKMSSGFGMDCTRKGYKMRVHCPR